MRRTVLSAGLAVAWQSMERRDSVPCRSAVSTNPVGGFRRERTFIEAQLNAWLWSTAAGVLTAGHKFESAFGAAFKRAFDHAPMGQSKSAISGSRQRIPPALLLGRRVRQPR